jgi:hypothetical protein
MRMRMRGGQVRFFCLRSLEEERRVREGEEREETKGEEREEKTGEEGSKGR